MTTLESDLKRMVFNWKDVYARTSEAHRDAEKVRKIVTLHFKYKGLNPHYVVDPDYVSFPTPLLAEDNKAGDNENSDIETPARDGRPRGRIVLRRPSQKIPAAPVSDEETPESQPVGRYCSCFLKILIISSSD